LWVSRKFVTAAVFVLVAAACTSAGAEVADQAAEAIAPPTSAPPTTTAPPPPTTTTVADPLPEPETIGALSRLGRMTWELHDLDFMVTHVGSYKEGYVALLYPSLAHRPEYGGLAEPGLVATSEDGVAWTPLPEQPGTSSAFTAQVLAVDGDRLVVLGRPFAQSGAPRTDDLLAFVWDGLAWSEVPVDIPVGSLTRGGQIDAGYLADGTPIFLTVHGGAWYEAATGFDYAPETTQAWPSFLARFDTIDVWPTDSGISLPATTIAAALEHEGRCVAVATPGSGGQAWTSTDGSEWMRIAPIAAPWGPAQDGFVVSPEIIEAGEIGWVAVGSWSGTGAIWVSSDGISWGLLEEIPGPAGWDPRVPWPPATVVDDERMLIYGRAHDAVLPSSSSMVWVGTVDE
jgi:hypothetical protein